MHSIDYLYLNVRFLKMNRIESKKKTIQIFIFVCSLLASCAYAQTSKAVLNGSSCAKPEYPSSSRRSEEEGTVQLKFLVGADGKILHSEVEKSSGFGRLDQATLEALSKCNFKPGMKDGLPIESFASLRYTFKLPSPQVPANSDTRPAKSTSAGEISFEPNSSYVASSKLTTYIDKAKAINLEVIVVVGYAESSEINPQQLSLSRAESIKFVMVSSGINPDRIYVEAKGAPQLAKSLAQIEIVGTVNTGTSLTPNKAGNRCEGNVQSLFDQCIGLINYKNGDSFYGYFQKGRRQGEGTFTFANGDKYVGSFVDDKFQGQGKFTWKSSGNFYIGEFDNSIRQGLGYFVYGTGERFAGQYKNEKREGFGAEYLSDGSVLRFGKYKNGNLNESGLIDKNLQQTLEAFSQKTDPEFYKKIIAKRTELENGEKAKEQETIRIAEAQKRDEAKRLVAENTKKIEADKAIQKELEQQRFENERLRAEAAASKTREQQLEAEIQKEKEKVANSKPQFQVSKIKAYALVVGNAAYSGSGKLVNPTNDAKAMSQKLKSLGFHVTEVLDATRPKLAAALSQFSQASSSADLTLLYYAGHGGQISGINYMLPIDLDFRDLKQVSLQGISLNSVVEEFMPGKTKLIFFDACRDNPLMQVAGRSVQRGLAPINVSEGTLISFATKDGQLAQDGVGKNSPFTTALLEHLSDPDDIQVILRKVREKVMKNTGGKQQPWDYGSLTGGALVLSAIKPK